jgi:putative inorganic carbon (HCO3(-)) transporter
VVGLLLFTSLVWTQLLVITVVIGTAFWVIRWLATGKISIRTPVDWGNILLVLLVGVSCLITSLPGTTAPQVLRLLSGVIFFYAIVNWSRSIKRSCVLLSMLALVGVSLSLFALVSVDWSPTKLQFVALQVRNWFPIAVSDTVHPNVMAGTLLLFAPIVCAVVVFNRWSSLASREKKIAYLLCGLALLSIAPILLLTVSRGAWVALITALAILVSLRWKWGLLVVVALIASAVLVPYLISPIDLLGIAMENQPLGSLMARLEVWDRATFIIEVFPFTGVGMGLYPDVVALIYPLVIASPELAVHAHNLFLQVAVDLGIPGLIAWLSVLMVVFTVSWGLYRNGRRLNDPWLAGLGAGFFCSTAALVLHGFVDAVVWGMVRQAPVVWFLWGTTTASFLVYLPNKPIHANTEIM